MRCTSKRTFCLVLAFALLLLTGCKGAGYSAKYSMDESASDKKDDLFYPTFASDLCVADEDKKPEDSDLEIYEKASAGLFDLTRKETIYSKNINLRVMPASLTKVMTAYVALKYGSLDQVLTAKSDVYVNESGAQKVNLKEGDKMTLDQALHLLLIYSANDVANLIASNITGPQGEDFITLMNEEAVNIGATNSHFENPHGLTSDEHYVTAYDMYLQPLTRTLRAEPWKYPRLTPTASCQVPNLPLPELPLSVEKQARPMRPVIVLSYLQEIQTVTLTSQ